MNEKLSLILKLILMAFVETIFYIFLHEAGHALVAVLCGAKITSFSIIGTHTSSVGGNYTPITSALLHIMGMLLPIFISTCYILICFNKNRKGEWYRIFSMFFWLIPAGSLLAWILIPIAFMAGDTTSPDDVIKFLNVSGIHPVIVMSLSVLFFAGFVFLAWKKGIIQIWLDIVSKNIKH